MLSNLISSINGYDGQWHLPYNGHSYNTTSNVHSKVPADEQHGIISWGRNGKMASLPKDDLIAWEFMASGVDWGHLGPLSTASATLCYHILWSGYVSVSMTRLSLTCLRYSSPNLNTFPDVSKEILLWLTGVLVPVTNLNQLPVNTSTLILIIVFCTCLR